MASKSALIVKLGQIGDAVMAIPAARALYDQGFSIDWLCGRAARPILDCYSWIRTIPVDDKILLAGSVFERAKLIGRLWSVIGLSNYDVCATLYYDRRYRLLTWPVRARRKIALSRQDRACDLLPGRHHTDEFVRILLQREDSCQDRSARPVRPDRLPPCPIPAKGAVRRIAIVPGAAGNLLRKQLLGLQPEGLRRWPIGSFVAVAQQLLLRNWEVVVLGGPDEQWVRPHFADMSVTDCVGKLSLPEVVIACDSCDAVIANDTGVLHLAGLSDTCVIGLFGPTDPAMRVPRRPFSIGLWGGEGFACRPCYDGVEFAPCQFNGCMHQISPEMVIRQLDQQLNARANGRADPSDSYFAGGIAIS